MIKFKHVDSVSGRGLAVKAIASQSKGRELEFRCEQEIFLFCKSLFCSLQLEEAQANEINHDIHLANTLFQLKVRQKKNMAAVCSSISLFMSDLIICCRL